VINNVPSTTISRVGNKGGGKKGSILTKRETRRKEIKPETKIVKIEQGQEKRMEGNDNEGEEEKEEGGGEEKEGESVQEKEKPVPMTSRPQTDISGDLSIDSVDISAEKAAGAINVSLLTMMKSAPIDSYSSDIIETKLNNTNEKVAVIEGGELGEKDRDTKSPLSNQNVVNMDDDTFFDSEHKVFFI
jgi:hypothetical protein